MFKNLDPLLHSQLRLAIVSHLISEGVSDFKTLKKITQATSGNLSVQIKKLETAAYIKIEKSFVNNYPNTTVRLTSKGIEAFDVYVNALKSYLK